jgi:hypothetical protein
MTKIIEFDAPGYRLLRVSRGGGEVHAAVVSPADPYHLIAAAQGDARVEINERGDSFLWVNGTLFVLTKAEAEQLRDELGLSVKGAL